MQYHGFELKCHKRKIFGQYWYDDDPRVLVILVHGMGEHSGRYSHFVVPELVAAGCAVIGFDHFGHGHSEGKRGVNPGYNAVLDSVAKVMKKGRSVFPEIPVLLYGHSMGGNVVLGYMLEREHDLQGVIATSPFLKLAYKPSGVKMFAGKMLGKLLPEMTMSSGLDPNMISRDKEEVRQYLEDPLVHERASASYVFPFLEMGEKILEKAEEIRTPVFLAHGTGDGITSWEASKALAERSDLVNLKLYDQGYHELHNDLVKEELMNDLTTWIDQTT
ncbi:alpha/beta hydrolase [Robertkochia aurantiaca]|uniref:alpha/beta hydrolase n=1 Tax=Robertkochia aurantiaca TaxID=2873700 RepID=UPI001CCBE3B0|nr:alpha/beta hydrolase [Robertkochia sp. 3YJGBD-33]